MLRVWQRRFAHCFKHHTPNIAHQTSHATKQASGLAFVLLKNAKAKR